MLIRLEYVKSVSSSDCLTLALYVQDGAIERIEEIPPDYFGVQSLLYAINREEPYRIKATPDEIMAIIEEYYRKCELANSGNESTSTGDPQRGTPPEV